MDKEKYGNGYYYNIDDTVIRLLFGCDSQRTTGYISNCPKTNIELTETIKAELVKVTNIPKWGEQMDDNEKYLLKKISLLYDGVDLVTFANNTKPFLLILDYLNSGYYVNEEIYCSSYKLLLKIDDPNLTQYAEQIKEYLTTNLDKITSSRCIDAISTDTVNPQGLYMRITSSKQQPGFEILEKCNLLNLKLQ